MKTKVRLVKAEKQNPLHQMMLIPNKKISTTEDLDETEQKEVQNEKWKGMFKIQQKSEPSYFAFISDGDSRRNMRKLYPK